MKKNKIKILVISHDFVKKVNIKIYEELDKIDKFDLLCVRPKKLVVDNVIYKKDFSLENSNIEIIERETKFSNLRFLYFKKIKNIIKNYKPNYIIVHNDPVSNQTLRLIFLSFFFNFSIICFSNENEIGINFKNFNFKIFYKTILLKIFNFFIKVKIKKIFCISRQIKNCYDNLGYEKKTILTPLGYDPKIFKKRKKNQRSFIISYFGRISKEKGIHILIKALERLDFNYKFFLDISHIEDKNYYKLLRSKLKKFLDHNRLILINCNHFEISKYMAKSNLVILPSIYEEQYGRVIQESVACGSLVLGSKVGAIKEIINDDDLLFKKGDFVELSKKIDRLRRDKKLYKSKLISIYDKIRNNRTIDNQLAIMKKNII